MISQSHRRRRGAFSLIEVSLAILIIAMGLLSLFPLFPLGLHQGELSVTDTHEAQFAEHVLSQLEANAAAIREWSVWSIDRDFQNRVTLGVWPVEGGAFVNRAPGVEFPNPGGMIIRYELRFSRQGSPRLQHATLFVKSGRYGSFDEAKIFTTSFIYMGM